MENNPYDIALQLEAAAAQLRAIGTLPETQRDGPIKQAMKYMLGQVCDVCEKVRQLNHNYVALNKQVQAHTYKLSEMRMGHMRDVKTNEPIADFPLRAKDFRNLDSFECERIANALGRVENLGEIGERQQTVIHLVGLDTAAVYHWV
ncbi:uncharacterized protein J4E92_010868 [Alternaria infectoria]|uniref:uncharacterized protein n=1 Tax=Alternaria infectoria TaxID=45303 RepID=UPI0022200B32|nr:uncharacterized protein J4E92_010868 [Alternaria infectoria]KAI4908469.1 hypothetical protein J4E92_010868 [Alternaria infectoria]